jgi:hypothetical protein
MTTLQTNVSPDQHEERDVKLGPFFLTGAILVVYGLRRRKKLAVAAGFGAIWLDQRSELGRGLKKRIRARTDRLAELDRA